MNQMLHRGTMPKVSSLRTFSEYRKQEAFWRQQSVSTDGPQLEYETLELRVHPPNVEIDNELFEDRTLITLDSANRPGTLVELVQALTELGLNVKKARISSDGGWFIDSFEVTDNNRKVVCERKIKSICQVLNVEHQDADSEPTSPIHGGSQGPSANDKVLEESRQCTTVLELAGTDRPGLLADVLQLLKSNGCDVGSTATWTYNARAAMVISVLQSGAPIQEGIKLQRLKALLSHMMDATGESIVLANTIKGRIHYERRLHQLLLREEESLWLRSAVAAQYEEQMSNGPTSTLVLWQGPPSSGSVMQAPIGPPPIVAIGQNATSNAPSLISSKASRPDVMVQHYKHLNYWLVSIKCKDRKKLFFDTVCTLADLEYDVYHASVDTDSGMAFQVFYIRPTFGDFFFDIKLAAKLKYMLELAIQRRFPKGLKLHIEVFGTYDICQVMQSFKGAGLQVTRAKVRPFSRGHTFYIMDKSGAPPDIQVVHRACQAVGGKLIVSDNQGSGSAHMKAASGGSAHVSSHYSSSAAAVAAAAATATMAAQSSGAKFGFSFSASSPASSIASSQG